MSLRALHLLFIALSVGLAALFGWWAIRDGSPALGAASFVAGAALVIYGAWFRRKTRGMGGK